jgi:hypothetical protein
MSEQKQADEDAVVCEPTGEWRPLAELLGERVPQDPATAQRIFEWLGETVARADAGEFGPSQPS